MEAWLELRKCVPPQLRRTALLDALIMSTAAGARWLSTTSLVSSSQLLAWAFLMQLDWHTHLLRWLFRTCHNELKGFKRLVAGKRKSKRQRTRMCRAFCPKHELTVWSRLLAEVWSYLPRQQSASSNTSTNKNWLCRWWSPTKTRVKQQSIEYALKVWCGILHLSDVCQNTFLRKLVPWKLPTAFASLTT